MALACRPNVVVLDEPTTGLDVNTQARVLDLLNELARTSGAAFVYVTHDLAVVDAIANQVAVMYSGRIVESGPRSEVLYRPAHPYTAMLVASVPRLSAACQPYGHCRDGARRHATGRTAASSRRAAQSPIPDAGPGFRRRSRPRTVTGHAAGTPVWTCRAAPPLSLGPMGCVDRPRRCCSRFPASPPAMARARLGAG